MVLLFDSMQYKDWQRVANAARKKWHSDYTLDTSDSAVWKLYRRPMFIRDGKIQDKPVATFDKEKAVVYLSVDHFRLERSIEDIFGKILNMRSPVFKELEDGREYFFNVN
jgi:hypothetical protein